MHYFQFLEQCIIYFFNIDILSFFQIRSLRTTTGDGKLKMSENRLRKLPFIFIDDEGKQKMTFGDKRSDVHPAFTMLITIFMRNHNQIGNVKF